MSQQTKYGHVVKAVFESPWAILPRTFATIMDVVRFRAAGGQLTDEEIQTRLEAAVSGPRSGRRNGLVAVLPVYGVISPRQNLMSQTSGGTTLDQLGATFDQVLADPDVAAIVLEFDSPGGAINGVEEMAAKIRAARGQKPIVAVANTLMASAAYWLGSQADEIVASPSSEVGSIGVIAAHQDISKAAELDGVKTTLIASSKFKAEGNQFEPLSDEARAQLQKQVDYFGGMFETTVAKGRGVAIDTVRSSFGQGRVLTPKDALASGMIDRIDTLDATITRLARGGALRLAPADPALTGFAAADNKFRATLGTSAEEAAAFVNQMNKLAAEFTEHDEDAPLAGVPFAAHAERVLLDVKALVRRAGEIRALRAEDGRDLSEAKRTQLSAIAEQLAAAHGSFVALLEEPALESAAEDANPSAASARQRRLALAEASLAGLRLN